MPPLDNLNQSKSFPMSLAAYSSSSVFFFGLLLFPAFSAGQCGFVDRDGQIVVKPVYDAVHSFTMGYAAVEKNGKWGYIRVNGDVTIQPQFESADYFSDGLAAVSIKEEGQLKFGSCSIVLYICNNKGIK